jgi:hypothetical protein
VVQAEGLLDQKPDLRFDDQVLARLEQAGG